MTTMSNAERRALATLRSDQSTWFDLTTLMNEGGFADVSMAVSYTHLTLPTIYSE